MVRAAPGAAPQTLGWRWQRVDRDRKVVGADEGRCVTCHQDCGIPPDGYEATCALP
jgi:hypothetical protein